MDLGNIIQICIIVFGIGVAWAGLKYSVDQLKKDLKKIVDEQLALKLYFEKGLNKIEERKNAELAIIHGHLKEYDQILGIVGQAVKMEQKSNKDRSKR